MHDSGVVALHLGEVALGLALPCQVLTHKAHAGHCAQLCAASALLGALGLGAQAVWGLSAAHKSIHEQYHASWVCPATGFLVRLPFSLGVKLAQAYLHALGLIPCTPPHSVMEHCYCCAASHLV